MTFNLIVATADLIVEQNQKILLVRRKYPPFQGKWALPGGCLEPGKETIEQTAVRELKEETNLIAQEKDILLLGIYSSPDRDPRGHFISNTYIVKAYIGKSRAGDDAKETGWFSLDNLPELAFDHTKIIKDYVKKYNNDKLEFIGKK